jgi:23S rRNA pseudouridine1911/1915/1917 synthase
VLLQPGAVVELSAPTGDQAKRPIAEPEQPLGMLYLDEVLVALDKPAGQPTHPLKLGERGTLANALVARYPECAEVSDDPREGGVAHRLDRDTTGIVLAARTRQAWLALRRAFSSGQVEKEYWAVVAGTPSDEGEVDVPLAHARDPRKVEPAPLGQGRPATTKFAVLARAAGVALVVARTRTGRMHQVRAHLAFAGHPLIGDPLYGGPPGPAPLTGHFLHARAVTVPHPLRGTALRLESPLPEDRQAALAALGLRLPQV